jgi:hypothetical protein
MYRWLRNVHLLLGLFALPFLLMYGVSAVRLAHGSRFSEKAKQSERDVEVGYFDANSGRAGAVLAVHGNAVQAIASTLPARVAPATGGSRGSSALAPSN